MGVDDGNIIGGKVGDIEPSAIGRQGTAERLGANFNGLNDLEGFRIDH